MYLNDLDTLGFIAIFLILVMVACFFGAIVGIADLNPIKFLLCIGIGLLAYWLFRRNSAKRDRYLDEKLYGKKNKDEHIFGKEKLKDD